MTPPPWLTFLRVKMNVDYARPLRRALVILVLLVAGFAIWVVVSLTADRPVTYEAIADHFKYGSIGSEPGVSLLSPVGGVLPPYQVFMALPSICPEKLPGGY